MESPEAEFKFPDFIPEWEREIILRRTLRLPHYKTDPDFFEQYDSQPWLQLARELNAHLTSLEILDKLEATLDEERSWMIYEAAIEAIVTIYASYRGLPEIPPQADRRCGPVEAIERLIHWCNQCRNVQCIPISNRLNAWPAAYKKLRLLRVLEPETEKTKEVPDGLESRSLSHSEDFTSVIWFGTKYLFNKTQARVVKALWTEWENGGHGLGEETIAEVIGTNATRFRLRDTFRRKKRGLHPAWGEMIQARGKGIFGLAEREGQRPGKPPENPS